MNEYFLSSLEAWLKRMQRFLTYRGEIQKWFTGLKNTHKTVIFEFEAFQWKGEDFKKNYKRLFTQVNKDLISFLVSKRSRMRLAPRARF